MHLFNFHVLFCEVAISHNFIASHFSLTVLFVIFAIYLFFCVDYAYFFTLILSRFIPRVDRNRTNSARNPSLS